MEPTTLGLQRGPGRSPVVDGLPVRRVPIHQGPQRLLVSPLQVQPVVEGRKGRLGFIPAPHRRVLRFLRFLAVALGLPERRPRRRQRLHGALRLAAVGHRPQIVGRQLVVETGS